MKNKLILTSALVLALTLSGCGGGSIEETAPAADNAADTVADTVADTAADLSESPEAETEETGATAEESEEQTAEPTEEAAHEDGEEENISGETDKFYNGVFHGSGYTLAIDSTVWTDMSVMIDYVRKAANKSDIDFGIDFTAEQYSDVYDGMFICPDSEGANFNMTAVDMGMDLDISSELFGAVLEQQYSAIEGCTFYGCEDSRAAGYDCVKAELEMTSGNVTLRMLQCCFWENGMQLVITFTAHPEEYDEFLPEFQKVLESLSFEDNGGAA